MTFDEVDIGTDQDKSVCNNSLKDFCTSDEWREEAERFRCRRKSLELDSQTGLERDATHQDLVSDTWMIEPQSSNPCLEEVEELEDAYRAMSKLTAEYLMVERAAAKYTRSSHPILHQRVLPTLIPGGGQRKQQGVSECKEQLLPKPNYLATVFKESTLLCREWLLEHYECRDGVSIPRSAMYSHYLDHCSQSSLDPLNPAGFGKAVRSIFVHVQTRRLGNRGASKYHYYGLSIKDSSPYCSILQSMQRVNNLNDLDIPLATNFHPRTVSLSEDGARIVLDGFPSVLSIPLTGPIRDKVREFLPRYRSHAECVVELVLSTCFAEVKDRLTQFWAELPHHLTEAMSEESVVSIVHLCDLAVYKSLAGMLIPSVSEHVPTNLLSAVRDLTDNLLTWTQEATRHMPTLLQAAKLTAASDFRQQMERQCVVCHLSQGVKATLRDGDTVRQMVCDWLSLDLQQAVRDVRGRVGGDSQGMTGYYLQKYLREFEKLLSHRASLDKFFVLVNNILHGCSAKHTEEEGLSIDRAMAAVLLHWNVTVSVLLREFTTRGTSTFGSFHLLGMLLTDYMMYLIEDKRRALTEVRLKDRVYSGSKYKTCFQKPIEEVLSDFKPIAPKGIGCHNTFSTDYTVMATTTVAQNVEIPSIRDWSSQRSDGVEEYKTFSVGTTSNFAQDGQQSSREQIESNPCGYVIL